MVRGSALGSLLALVESATLAATLIPQASPSTPWRVIETDSPAPRTATRMVDLAPAPRSSIIPAETAILQRSIPTPTSAARGVRVSEQELPADADVAAAPIRPPHLLRPSLSGGVPTGFVGGWGDYFLSGSAGTPGNLRGGSPDGSINLGFGLGDPERLVGAELFWGIGSIKNLNANGAFGGVVGRLLVRRPDLLVGAAGGVVEAFPYGFEPNPQPTNGYGALSVALPLRPADPVFRQMVQFTAGGGGSSFAAVDSTFQTAESGVFGAAGIELSPSIGVSVGVSSRSTNLNLSWIPLRTLPVFVNLMAADVFSATPWGTIGVLSVGWGDSLKTGLVTR
jgi:hypothetical protein